MDSESGRLFQDSGFWMYMLRIGLTGLGGYRFGDLRC